MKPKKQYIIRKYIVASSAQEAIRKDRSTPVEDVWIDEDWKKSNFPTTQPIGFSAKFSSSTKSD